MKMVQPTLQEFELAGFYCITPETHCDLLCLPLANQYQGSFQINGAQAYNTVQLKGCTSLIKSRWGHTKIAGDFSCLIEVKMLVLDQIYTSFAIWVSDTVSGGHSFLPLLPSALLFSLLFSLYIPLPFYACHAG